MTAPEDTFNSSQGSSSTVPEENLPSRATISPPASLSAEFSQETSSAGVDSHEFKKPQTPGRLKRPTLVKRMSSGTMIIPRDQPIEGPEREYPPDDVRSMSPRRSSEITQNLFDNCRESRVSSTGRELSQSIAMPLTLLTYGSINREAMDLQDTLAVLAEKIEDATAGCETLEKNNQALQDAIGDMTRNLSKESFTKKKK
ncbi:MAG: hypothetical protein LQ351_000954 [Letrouitia transgressa]|nr:MAG: hypothetical protein LQ351_000954 [Letrouitia transgressa]